MTDIEMIQATRIARDAAYNELRMALSCSPDDENPLHTLDRFMRRYPNHGDFDREREATYNAQVAVNPAWRFGGKMVVIDCEQHGRKFGYCEECLFPRDEAAGEQCV